MAKIVFGMNMSLDGYVDHTGFAPGPELFRHFITQTRGMTGALYGRKLYEIMRYWDDENTDWNEAERDFGAAWRTMPKWVVSDSLPSVGPNAMLISGDLDAAVRRLKNEQDGEIEVGGPDLASSLTKLDLIDEYRIYLHPVVLGQGTPYFTAPRPKLRLLSSKELAEDVVMLTYAPT